MKSVWLFIFIFCIAISSFAQQTAEEEQIMELSTKKWNWMINKKYDSLQSILHDRVTYIHSNGWSQSKKDIIDDFKSGKLVIKSVEIQSQTTQIFNQTAILNGMAKVTGETNGAPFSLNLVYTEGYIKENGKWLLVSRLATKSTK
jgi:hypothetical protein